MSTMTRNFLPSLAAEMILSANAKPIRFLTGWSVFVVVMKNWFSM